MPEIEAQEKPKRIQRKRSKGWKMPPNTLCATRPGKFGNPFKVGMYVKLGNGGNGMTYTICIDKSHATAAYTYIDTTQQAVDIYREYRKRYPLSDELLARLGAAEWIACFCPLTEPCHVEVLLEIANAMSDSMTTAALPKTREERKAAYEQSALKQLMELSGHEICTNCYCCDLISERVICWACGGLPDEEDEDGGCSECDGNEELTVKNCIGRCDDNGNHKKETR